MVSFNKIKYLFQLVKFEHTIFALPFALYGYYMGEAGKFDFRILILVLLSMVGARTAAMSFNRIVDYKYDRINPRTKNRPLVSGKIKWSEAFNLFILSSLLFVTATFYLNKLSFYLSPIALFIVCFYSLTKRFTSFCHFFLGIALAISPIGGYIAVRGTFNLTIVLIGIALFFWVAGFDIIYSTMDYEFDRKHSLYSMVVKKGIDGSLRVSRILHFFTIFFFTLAGFVGKMGLLYFIAIFISSIFIVIEHRLAVKRDVKSINNAFFLANGVISFTIFVFGTIDIYIRNNM